MKSNMKFWFFCSSLINVVRAPKFRIFPNKKYFALVPSYFNPPRLRLESNFYSNQTQDTHSGIEPGTFLLNSKCYLVHWIGHSVTGSSTIKKLFMFNLEDSFFSFLMVFLIKKFYSISSVLSNIEKCSEIISLSEFC